MVQYTGCLRHREDTGQDDKTSKSHTQMEIGIKQPGSGATGCNSGPGDLGQEREEARALVEPLTSATLVDSGSEVVEGNPDLETKQHPLV
ncbi:hypothetical protein NDU88_004771 [Pleurodeles waltl]|uniref:Uncharacterized protein n=1 Tax=Pleurodeles waltl TaxID=8319 RepID=A0AAV7LMH5_PLEWA|nr:hypothetical protein NDU88_004771 [Pleurodeles waltl]